MTTFFTLRYLFLHLPSSSLLFSSFYDYDLENCCTFAAGNKNNSMQAATLTPTQQHLLKLFSFNNSEAFAREIQMVLTKHFQALLDAEADKLWDEGILNQERLDAMRFEDFHAKK